MPLIGTAGHVDHGKSTLIQALTGRDPDRWAEEKRRGLTIDLGFAWTTLPDGTEVSFVDVPGHERYLKNMLAGVEAIDVALLVVAADEGWMPQSEEHLAVLDLLDVRAGAVALTKIDAVDPDLAELAHLEVTERLDGTSLDGVSIIPVSGVTGEGLDDLRQALVSAVASMPVADIGRPRLWVDRAFSATGAGTIVTGTLLDGGLRVDDQVRIYPGDRVARLRGIQSHERALEQVGPGRRVALNLVGIDADAVSRGDMAGRPGDWETSSRFSVTLRPARYVEELDRKGAYQLHIGSRAIMVRFLGLDGDVALLQTEEQVPVAVGDRFIIRDTGRKLVVAGGRVLDPSPGPTRAALAAARKIDPAMAPDDSATVLLTMRGVEDSRTLSRQTKGGAARSARSIGDLVLTDRRFDEWKDQAETLVRAEHDAHPLRVGLPLATLAERIGTDTTVAELVIAETADLERIGPDVAVAGREIGLDPGTESEWQRTREMLSAALAVPTIDELGIDPELLHLQIRLGNLVRVSGSLVFLPDQIETIRATIAEMTERFTVADFRDATGLSRKYAVPILEWADMEGLTLRQGDTRSAR